MEFGVYLDSYLFLSSMSSVMPLFFSSIIKLLKSFERPESSSEGVVSVEDFDVDVEEDAGGAEEV